MKWKLVLLAVDFVIAACVAAVAVGILCPFGVNPVTLATVAVVAVLAVMFVLVVFQGGVE